MEQEAKIFWKWIQHDMLGKLLFNIALAVILWSKIALSRFIIYYWFGQKYIPSFSENIFGLSPKLNRAGMLCEIIIKILFSFVLANFLRAAFSDPGYVHLMNLKMPKNLLAEKLEKNCIKCNNRWKPPRAHHCRVCTKCVLKMDHHCRWIANCVGARNQKFFILFLFYSACYSLSGVGLCIMNLVLWLIETGQRTKGPGILSDGWGLFNRIALAVAGLFFLFFTFDFLWEQGESVIENQSTVETYKEMVGRPGTLAVGMRRVFGTNKWAWMLPIAPKLDVNALELLYYHVEVSGDKTGKERYIEDEWKKLDIYKDYYIK